MHDGACRYVIMVLCLGNLVCKWVIIIANGLESEYSIFVAEPNLFRECNRRQLMHVHFVQIACVYMQTLQNCTCI